MLKETDRVRFIDERKDKLYGVLIILNIKNDIATLTSGDYATFGQSTLNAKISELKKAD